MSIERPRYTERLDSVRMHNAQKVTYLDSGFRSELPLHGIIAGGKTLTDSECKATLWISLVASPFAEPSISLTRTLLSLKLQWTSVITISCMKHGQYVMARVKA